MLREQPADFAEDDAQHSAVALVRPYARTQGRTRPRFELAIEVLVSACPGARGAHNPAYPEYGAISQLCVHARSVAEIAALLKLPLAVARVLISDMAHLGLVNVHQTATSGSKPTRQLLERVLQGLYEL